MVLAKIFSNGEDLTAGKGVLIRFDTIKDIESDGLRVVLMQ